ncbi:MAG TPA: hypothetical protein VND64_15680 [Pirellulales bacterium]|nr:hypothetical protein [Pirellulales bacterium]
MIGVGILCLPLALLAWKMNDKRNERATVRALRAAGAEVHYAVGNSRPAPGPAFLRAFLGDDFFCQPSLVTFPQRIATDDACLGLVRDLHGLRGLIIENPALTDAGLANLASLERLTILSIEEVCSISDDGLAHLGGLRRLKNLAVMSPRISDAGLAHVERLESLEVLTLSGSSITDAGLGRLSKLGRLKVLHVRDTMVTERGIAEVRNALPNCLVPFP